MLILKPLCRFNAAAALQMTIDADMNEEDIEHMTERSMKAVAVEQQRAMLMEKRFHVQAGVGKAWGEA